MTIDRTKLIELLIEKTNLSTEEVETQLEQLIERILDAAERGKALEIKEFGLFFFDQEGDLKFEPSEELSTEISFKYAGMKPVELKPERNTAIPAEDDSIDSINDEDDVIVVPKSESKSSPVKPETTPKTIPAAKSKSTSKPVSKQPIRKKRDRSAVWALLAFFAVLFIGALIYFNRQVDPIPEDTAAVSNAIPEEYEIIDAPGMISNGDPDLENDELSTDAPTQEPVTNELNAEQIPAASVPLQNQIYGLTGEVVEEANSGFSIVVHSFFNEVRATEVAENFRAEGYRVQVTTRVIDGQDVWRVSLGQFESIPDAQEAAETLPEPINENNFIQRIQ